MPKDRKRAPSTSDSDSGPEDRNPVKKGKVAGKSTAKPSASSLTESKDPSWHLGKDKHVTVREFRGKTYVDIREYYVDKNTMETKPGKKGIALSCEQYQKLKSLIDEIDHALP
eukprot:TRINITY_DN72348_c0_g1_i1.p1 TRINITY_DN72348_c0_g1~~TRINITY_DN72348_c0_g1_i1.p1  ORF type:complete len:122 (+),score=19.07 TRINITY_DN72348_c0_g1_i1:30-368(+)